MQSAYDLKERAATEAPLLLFDCELRDGRTERWSTHKVRVDGSEYEPRVIRHTLFEVQTSSDQGVDAIPRVSIVLANADSYLSQLERNVGLKGAKSVYAFCFTTCETALLSRTASCCFRDSRIPQTKSPRRHFGSVR